MARKFPRCYGRTPTIHCCCKRSTRTAGQPPARLQLPCRRQTILHAWLRSQRPQVSIRPISTGYQPTSPHLTESSAASELTNSQETKTNQIQQTRLRENDVAQTHEKRQNRKPVTCGIIRTRDEATITENIDQNLGTTRVRIYQHLGVVSSAETGW